jgi:hypothetical protein
MARRLYMRRWTVVLLFASLAGCTPTKVVRLDTGQSEPSVHVPRRDVEPVEVSQEEFKHAVTKHAPSVPAVERPLEYAGRLFGVPERSGWFWYEGRSQRLMAAEPGSHQNLRLLPEDEELKRYYLLWCKRTWGGGDCLRLLVDKPLLDGDAKYALAMAIAQIANGTPVRWIVAEEKLAGALRKMFTDAELPIEVIHVPPTPPVP